MRLLYLNHNYRYFGSYYRAMPMAEQMASRGHDITLMTVSRERRFAPVWSMVNGVRLAEMPMLALGQTAEGYGFLDIPLRIAHGLTHRYDIIHMFDHKPNATFAGFASRMMHKVLLVSDWADWWGDRGGINDSPRRFSMIGRFESWWEIMSKLRSDGIVTISTVLRERALAIGCPASRVIHIPTGAATQRIQPIPAEAARLKLGVPASRQIVGFIGSGQGDLEIVMRSLKQLPTVWLMIIGKKRQEMLDLARVMGVAERIWQTGFVPDEEVGKYLACADVMCLPMSDRAANRGRLPNKILDYMSAGRPTVANPVGDVKVMMETHKLGLLANDSEFANAMHVLLTDAALRTEMGHNARQVAETVYNWSHIADQLEGYYRNLLLLGNNHGITSLSNRVNEK